MRPFNTSQAFDTSFWKGRRVLITGHTGFKGSWLCLCLHLLGAKVFGYALEPPTNPSLFDLANVGKLVNSFQADIRDAGLLMDAIRSASPEIVIHMAAQPLVRESYVNPVDTYAINVMGTVNLLEAVRNCPSVRAVINVTTDKCYENREWVWGYRENEPMGGFDPYSNSKSCSELITSAYRNSYFNPSNFKQHRMALASARAGNVIGGGDWATDRLIPDCLRALLSGEKILIRNPDAIRPWQHVLEPLSGYLVLAEKLYKEGCRYAEGWNFGPSDDDARPVEWIVQRLCELWGDNAGYEIDTSYQPHEARYLKLDCSKAKTELGWWPRMRLETALIQIVAWMKAYKSGVDLQDFCLQQIDDYFTCGT